MINAISFTIVLEAQLKSIANSSFNLDWQKKLCVELLEKYFAERSWLQEQYKKADLKALRPPVWPAPNEDAFYLVKAISMPTYIYKLACQLGYKVNEESQNPIFDERRDKLSSILKHSDIGQVNKNGKEKNYALFGIRAVKPNKRPYEILLANDKTAHEAFLEYQKMIQIHEDTDLHAEEKEDKAAPVETALNDSKFKKELVAMEKLLGEDKYFSEKQDLELY